MPLPLTVSCFDSKIQIAFTFLVLAHPGSPGKRAVKWVCVCVCDLDANLRQAIMQFSASDLYCSVEHIKIIVKQLTGCSRDNFSNKAAGALTC